MLKHLRTLSTLGFLLLIFAGLGHLAFQFVTDKDMKTSDGLDLSWQSAMDGNLTGEIGRRIDKAMPSTPLLDGLIDGLLYATLGDTGSQVREGCPGWLFLTEELVETPQGEENLAARVRLAKAIAAELARANTTLIVVPVPDKAQMLSDQELCHLQSSEQAKTRLAAWKDKSAELGLSQVNIATDWPKPGYWRTDTHWDQQGAQHAAHRVAAAISDQIGAGSTPIEIENENRPHERVGDLIKLADLAMTHDFFGPRADSEAPVKLKIERSGGLLDDVAEPDVLLAGSSYSVSH